MGFSKGAKGAKGANGANGAKGAKNAKNASSAFGDVSNSELSSESSNESSDHKSPEPKRRRTKGSSTSSSDCSTATTLALLQGGSNPVDSIKGKLPVTKAVATFRNAVNDAKTAIDPTNPTNPTAAPTVEMVRIGRAVLEMVLGLMTEDVVECATRVFPDTIFLRVVDTARKYVPMAVAGFKVPKAKLVIKKYAPDPMDPNTVRLELCGYPLLMTLGGRIVFYIPTPPLMKASGAISEEGFVDPYARLTPNFNDPDDVTVIEMSGKDTNNFNTILRLFVIVAINYLKLRGLFPDTADSIPSSQASNFNGMIGAQMMEMIKKELEITFDGNRWNPALLEYMCGVGVDIPDFRTLYRTVLRALLSGFERASMMARAWSSGTSAPPALAGPALPAFPAPPALADSALFSNSADGVQWDEETEI